jgi:hypothetical protein
VSPLDDAQDHDFIEHAMGNPVNGVDLYHTRAEADPIPFQVSVSPRTLGTVHRGSTSLVSTVSFSDAGRTTDYWGQRPRMLLALSNPLQSHRT